MNISKISCNIVTLFLSFSISSQVNAQSLPESAKTKMENYFKSYHLEGYRPNGAMKMDSINVGEEGKVICIYMNEPFCSQPFTPSSVRLIYSHLQQLLPAPYNAYHLNIYNAKGTLIEDLIPNVLREDKSDETRLWKNIHYEGLPWVRNTSLPYTVSNGLQGRHLFIWPSHGRYYKNGSWQWQRPYLFCTTEDLFTQSFVYPYLFPMLEKAGAIVYSPRERDIQTHEATIDNDAPTRQGTYTEISSDDSPWSSSGEQKGFKAPYALLNDSTYPFQEGTYRMVAATSRKARLSTATWTPRIPCKGRYAVYVSYATLPNSVPDAHYTIFHKGGRTNVQVNQQMGGGTWVYVGTYEFDEGENSQGRVVLSNQSNHRGIVSADAVHFGGGVGQVERGTAGTSGLPRYLEAARYHAQWCGLPDSLFNTEQGTNDYADDLRVRGNWLNYLGGGSPYLPGIPGKLVPFELSLAMHSDAGIRHDHSIYGSLSICTTQDANGKGTYPSGLSRQASQDFATLLLNNLTTDLSSAFRKEWTRREQWDRNYAETRMPDVPSAILEMLSHQNFEDMKYGHDPIFKYTLARSVYKTILRYVNFEHGITSPVVQPLPVHAFSAILSSEGNQVTLSWQPTPDANEPSATPTSYVVYTKVDDEDFDNGLNIGSASTFSMSVSPDKIYSFRVTAINAGGESFPSETLSVMHASAPSAKEVLIVNGFNRLSGPAWVENNDSIGFDLEADMGVPYLFTTSYAGKQRIFSPNAMGLEGTSSLGYCSNEMVGKVFAGNTFDFPLEHGKSIAAAKGFSFSSTSREAFENGAITLKRYAVIDYIAGLEANKPYNIKPAKVFTTTVEEKLTDYLKKLKGSLLLSGSYIASDNQSPNDKEFIENVLKFRYDGNAQTDTTQTAVGLNLQFSIFRAPNATHYATQAPDAILPSCKQSFPAFSFGEGQGAGVAYKGNSYRVVSMSFPFECIVEPHIRHLSMKALLHFLTD